MFKHLGTAFLALFTLIMWSAAVIGIAIGWLVQGKTRFAWGLGFVSAVVVFGMTWQTTDWLPIQSVWQPYERESDLVVILLLSVIAGCYAHATVVFRKSYAATTPHQR